MSEEYVTRLRDARKWFNNDGQCCGQVDCVGICAAPACIFGEALKEFGRAADCIEAQAAEIARLRAALATARREGMEMPPEFLEWVKREMPSGTHIHNPEWWASRVWKAAALAAAKEVKP